MLLGEGSDREYLCASQNREVPRKCREFRGTSGFEISLDVHVESLGSIRELQDSSWVRQLWNAGAVLDALSGISIASPRGFAS